MVFDYTLFAGLAGGVGLFLLGMWLMTDGLKLAAGPALERILARSTGTRLRGLVSGIAITALVQSSSAVTIATIGFVNAGLLTLAQALWVLFGTNVGTTMTGWLVAVAGVDFKIEAFALPMVGLGMVLYLTGQGVRRGALGMTLAGFGVLFLGIDVLKTSFSDLGSQMTLPGGSGVLGVLAHVGAGALLTVLMQSSSAALAIALTAAQGGLVTLNDAAALVIGANVGTTVKAVIAALGATSNARRAAAAHVLFNLLTAGVALLLLPWLIDLIEALRDGLALEAAPAVTLALFHTLFNVLGVLLMWPLAGRLAQFLAGRFRTAEEDEAHPRHLDRTVLAVPAMALDALAQEVRRMGTLAVRGARKVWRIEPASGATALPETAVVQRLNDAIAAFVTELHRVSMAEQTARHLPGVLRSARYCESIAEIAGALATLPWPGDLGPQAHRQRLTAFVDETDHWLEDGLALDSASAQARLTVLGERYQMLKTGLLDAGADGSLGIHEMELSLRRLSLMRRLLEQLLKASITLDGLNLLPDQAVIETASAYRPTPP